MPQEKRVLHIFVELFYIDRKIAAANISFAKVAVQCSADTFVVNEKLVFRFNICAKNRHIAKSCPLSKIRA
jgi:hypothetical protein